MNARLSIPIEDFGDNDINSLEAGLAKKGFIGKLDLGIKVYKSLGICVSGMMGQNSIDEDTISFFSSTVSGIKE
jgi:hypothetical protein